MPQYRDGAKVRVGDAIRGVPPSWAAPEEITGRVVGIMPSGQCTVSVSREECKISYGFKDAEMASFERVG